MNRRSYAVRIASLGLSATLSVALAACGSSVAVLDDETSEPACSPGSSSSCACPDGTEGTQVCKESGEGYGRCECDGDADASVEDASDAHDGDDAGANADAASDDAGDADVSQEKALAAGLSITDILVYQSISVPIVRNRAEVANRNAPVIAGKDALLRVMVTPLSGWQPRMVVGTLELHDSNGLIISYDAKLTVTAASKEETLGSSFNFDIPGFLVKSDLEFKVTIREFDGRTYSGDDTAAEWPPSGTSKVQPRSSNGNLKLTIIPYRYNGRVPDTSEAHLQVFRDKFTSYPTPGVEITVHPVVDHSGTFTSGGNGWNQLLTKTCNLRGTEGADPNEYYYGLIVPANSAYAFCSDGCVAGLAPLARQANDSSSRCGIGLGFKESDLAAETAIHEIGHAMGREHAPCGLGQQSSDRNYPYSNAALGVWGWEAPKRALKHPSNVKDMMSYCSPIWISDYTYKAIFDRVSFVNSSALVKLPEGFPERWRSIVIEADGSVLWGETTKLDSVPSGTPTTVQLLDEAGKQVGEATGYFYGTDHLPGGWVVVPEEKLAGAKAVRLEGKAALAL